MSSFNERRASAGVFQSGNAPVNTDNNNINLSICNTVLSSDILTQNISKNLFQNNLPPEIVSNLKMGLLTMVGKTPP
jgi:hypothetical protein